jgi:hypothetical protein
VKAKVAVAAVNHGNHNYPLAGIGSYTAGIMSKYAALFHPSPIATIEVHISATNTACHKINKYPSSFDWGQGNVFDLNLIYTTVYSYFQKYSSQC